MKRFISSMLLTFLLTSALNANIIAEENIKVYVNGGEISFDQPPIIENNRTLVPFRAILDKMGAKVQWNADDKTITCTNGDVLIKLTVDSDEMTINDKVIKLDAPSKIINGRTLVPLRAITEGLGADVIWNEDSKSITIDTQIISKKSVTKETYEKEGKNANGEVVVKAAISYPVFNSYGESGDKINEYFRQSAKEEVEDYIIQVKADAEQYLEMTDSNGIWEYLIDCEVPYTDEDYISVVGNIMLYQGGAHPIKNRTTFLFNTKTGEQIYLNDVVGEDLEIILNLAEKGFKEKIENDKENYLINSSELNINNSNFYLSSDGYVFYFDPAVISPYVNGFVEYTVTKAEVEKAKKEKYGVSDNEMSLTKFVKKTIKEDEKLEDRVALYSDIEYPMLVGDAKGIDKINEDYYSYIKDLYDTFFSTNSGIAKLYLKETNPPEEFNSWCIYIRGDVSYVDKDKVCITTDYSYFTGGAHPDGYLSSFVYDLKTGKKLELEDLVENKAEIIQKVEAGVKAMINENPIDFFSDALQNLDMTNPQFYLTDNGIVFYFQKYELAPYSMGIVEYTVEW